MKQRIENEEHYCSECNKLLKKGKVVWLELILGTDKYYFHGIPKEKESQGWHPFGSTCAKNKRVD